MPAKKPQVNYQIRCSDPKHGNLHKYAKKTKALAFTRVGELNDEDDDRIVLYRAQCKPWFVEVSTATAWERIEAKGPKQPVT